MFRNLDEFYRSDEWTKFRLMIINDRTREDGFVYDEVTGKPIVRKYDVILHHKVELTEENVHDYEISLNPENIMIVSHKTHNILHDKLGYSRREVYLVYGPPRAGKTTWVRENMTEGDLVVDMDSVWECVSGCDRYVKPKRLNAVAFKVRDVLIDAVKYRLGRWHNAYVIGGYPLSSERERLCRELGAREVFIDATMEECIQRAEGMEGESAEDWKKFIAEWFERYHATFTPSSGD